MKLMKLRPSVGKSATTRSFTTDSTEERVASITGASDVTLTEEACVPIVNCTGTLMAAPTSTVTLAAYLAKPLCSAMRR